MNTYQITGNGTINIASTAKIAADVQFIFHEPSTITIGDYVVIGSGVKIICNGGNVNIGDWTTLHDRTLVLSSKGVTINQHCWFGQNTIIDGTGGITIGNGVRVGMYSQLWTHVAAGEQIEGCTLYGERPIVLEDDVWLVGSCIVASGVTIGRRTVALISSNITKSFPSNVVLAGSPATQKPNLNFYNEITLEKKWEMLCLWIEEIAAKNDLKFKINSSEQILEINSNTDFNDEKMYFVLSSENAKRLRELNLNSTICCIEDKTYNKIKSNIEFVVLKALSGNKARFFSN